MAKVQAQVRQWRDELIDLTRRNRLLNFNPKRGSSLHITAPTPDTMVDRLYAGSGWRFHYPRPDEKESEDVVLLAALEAEDPELDDELRADELLTDEPSPAKISRVLHALERRASSEWVDRGLRVLYLAVGKLRWFEVADQELNSPILLIPVSLHRESSREPFWLHATEDDAALNPALLVKLENDFGIVLSCELDPSDPLSVIDQVRTAVRDQPGWDVSDDVALSYFSFHKESMYQDLKAHEAELCAHPILQTLAGDEVEHVDFAFDPIPDDQLDAVAAPEDLVSILDADSTQRRCIAAARDGRTFVMDGPPGSGKSQTISNMIAELMATGKTVLFVSEKAAALEVVKKRLDDRGLGHYILELHSHKATRKEVAQALGRALTTEPRANGRMSADEIAKARSRRAALTEYAAAQNEVRQPLGRSLHWALGQLELLADAPTAPVPDAVGVDLSAKELQQIREATIRLESAWVAVDRSGEFLWRDLTDPPAARRRLGALGQELDSAIGLLTSLRSRADVLTDELLLQPVVTIGGLREIVALTTAIEDRPQNVPPAWLQLETLDEVEQRAQQLKTEAEHHLRRVEALRELAGSACDSLDTHSASEISEALEALAKASPPIDLAPEVTVDAVASLETFLSRLAETSTELNRLSVDVASSLGVKSSDLSPRNAQALAEAAQLSASPHLPESTWFDAQTISAARDAIVLLRPLVEQYEQLGAFITKAFTSDVSAFDVEALYDGPTDLSPNLSRWTSKGRENRRQLKGCVVGGKITDEVKAALPSVRQWKRVDTELQSVELERAPVLGPHYYKRGQTDFDATVAALNVATQAISLVSEQADRVALSRRLSRTSANDRLLAAKGERLLADLHRWREEIRCHLPHGADFDSFPFEQTRDWAVSRLAEVRRLSDALGQVRAVAALDDLGSLRNVAELRRANAETESAIEDRRSVDSVLLGPDYDGLATDWPRVERALDWAKRVRGIHQGPFTERPAEAMCTALINPARIEEDTERYQKYVDSVLDLFNPQQRGVLAADLESLDDAMSTLEELRQTTGQIEVWATYVESRAELVTAGLGEVVGFCEDNTREGVFVPSIIDRAVLTAWVDAVLADDQRCDPILAEQRDRLVSEYRDLDRMLIAHASGRVIESCNARRPRQSVGEPAIIQREATKKTRHRPIRTLLEEAGRAAQSLMPCFMMSPLSVSQFLPASLRFDVVIFDEASQVRPCDAVNSIYRGSQLIVAGDDRQLPPTSFFDRSDNNTDDEYDEDDLEVFESILDLCKGAAGIPALPLLWHYRSRHEDLITYSNRAFYDGKLITYPGAIQEAPG